MFVHRLRLLLFFALLLVTNWAGLSWWQSQPVATAHAQAQTVEAAQMTAATPTTFSYQGVLRNADGSLANGQFKLTINLYNDPLTGPSLYNEVFDPVAVTDGLFGLVVGDQANHPLDAALFANPKIFLGVTVGSDTELLPRQRLHPLPWAVNATLAQSAITAGKADAATTAERAIALREVGDGKGGAKQRQDYPMELRRYVVEAKDNGIKPFSVPVDDTLLVQLCGDEDGCSLSLGTRNPTITTTDNRFVMSFPYSFSVANAVNGTRFWHTAGFDDSGKPVGPSGADGTNGTENIISSGDCRFTDGAYSDGGDQGDTGFGFSVLNWWGHDDATDMVCVLVIND